MSPNTLIFEVFHDKFFKIQYIGKGFTPNEKAIMNDTPESDLPESLQPEEDEDEPIIDLVDEVVDTHPLEDRSELRTKLLDSEDEMEKVDEDAPGLPDLADLGTLDFDEPDEAVTDLASAEAASEDADESSSADDLDWLFDQEEEAASSTVGTVSESPDSELAEVLDFDEVFLDADDVLEDETESKAADVELEADAEDADALELIEIEDEEVDNEIIWFDDAKDEAPASEGGAETALTEEPELESFEDISSDTSAGDVFDAHLESGVPPPESEAAVADLTEDVLPAAAAGIAGLGAVAASSEPSTASVEKGVPEKMPPAEIAGLSPEAIEAAVERVIARKFGGTV